MVKLYFLYKTTCMANKRVSYGVHASNDIFFGTEHATDPYVGKSIGILEDLERYGRAAFVVEAIHAFPLEADAMKALEQYKPSTTYVPPVITRSDEFKKNLSVTRMGEGNPMYGKKMSDSAKAAISEHRSKQRWVNNGSSERQQPSSEPLAAGYTYGRLKTSMPKSRAK
jgi:hypothetical protein